MTYGLKYIVPFRTLTEIPCEVRIEVKDYSGQSIELIGGGTPFVINVDTSDLLSPIRSSSATLSVYGSDYLQDLYASDPQGVRVTLLVNGIVYWLGFLTPDTFSQNFTNPEFIYEMECVAAISSLKNKEFDLTDDFVTFRQIVTKAMENAGYGDCIHTDAVNAGSTKFFDLRIASSNFYDELGDAMTYYDVLEEIAKYAGCCFTPYKDILYFLDYAAIRSGYTSYTKFSGGVVTLQDLKTVKGYKGTGTKISRIAGKNKAVVNCSLYEIKDILPSFDDEKSIFSKMRDDFSEKFNKETYKGIIRYFRQPKFTFWTYTGSDPTKGNESEYPVGDGDAGSTFVKTTEYKTDSIPSKLSFTEEIQVRTYWDRSSALSGKHLDTTCPIYRVNSEKKIFIHSNVWFCISLKVKYQTKEWTMGGDRDEKIVSYTHYQRAKFRIGKYYYTGSDWTQTETIFRMKYKREKGEKEYGYYFGLENTNTFEKGIGDLQGYTFKAPDFPIMGDCEFTLYAFEDLPVSQLTTFGTQYVYYNQIKVDYGIPNEQSIYGDWVNKDSKNDLVYENVISDDYIDEADEIDLKICTNPDGKLALSSVLDGDAFLEKLTSSVYGTDIAENLLLKRVIDLYETPRFVIDPVLLNDAKPYSKFTEPHLNKQFLFAGGEEDVKMESTRYNLIEL